MTTAKFLPWLVGAALSVAVLLGVGYCREKESAREWREEADALEDSTAAAVKERDAVRLAVDVVTVRADSLTQELQRAPRVVIRRVPGGVVFVPDTTRPDSVIAIPAPVAERLEFLEAHVVAQSSVITELRAGMTRERSAWEGVESSLRAEIQHLQLKPRDSGWRLVFGAGYGTTVNVLQGGFEHGLSAFVGVARPVPLPFGLGG